MNTGALVYCCLISWLSFCYLSFSPLRSRQGLVVCSWLYMCRDLEHRLIVGSSHVAHHTTENPSWNTRRSILFWACVSQSCLFFFLICCTVVGFFFCKVTLCWYLVTSVLQDDQKCPRVSLAPLTHRSFYSETPNVPNVIQSSDRYLVLWITKADA